MTDIENKNGEMIPGLPAETIGPLIARALDARRSAYAPYSGFAVGAALLTADGAIYTGCNIENASYSPTVCAERTAFVKAVSDGARRFTAIAICGGFGDKLQYCCPCGVCRQVMQEFCDPKQFRILVAKSALDYKGYLLEELLPCGFGPDNLEK